MQKKLKDGEVVVIRSNNEIVLGNNKGLKLVLNKQQYKDFTDDQLIKLFNGNKVFNVNGSDINE